MGCAQPVQCESNSRDFSQRKEARSRGRKAGNHFVNTVDFLHPKPLDICYASPVVHNRFDFFLRISSEFPIQKKLSMPVTSSDCTSPSIGTTG
jgi:hypothetical protein